MNLLEYLKNFCVVIFQDAAAMIVEDESCSEHFVLKMSVFYSDEFNSFVCQMQEKLST